VIEPIKLTVNLESGNMTGWLQDGWYLPGYIFSKDHDNAYCWIGPFASEQGAREAAETHKHGILHIGAFE
jgi:hypothetical protein